MTTWPPVLHAMLPNFFVHLLALACDLLLAYLVAFTVALVQTLRGVSFAAEHVAGVVINRGLDATVDARDGPNRHGFRGKRGQTING